MLLSYAPLITKNFRGAAYLLQKTWQSNPVKTAEAFLLSIEANLNRIENDPQSTQFFVKDLEMMELNDLHSALEQSLKQEGFHTKRDLIEVGLFTCKKVGAENFLFSKRCSFLKPVLITEAGEAFGIENLPEKSLGWSFLNLDNEFDVNFSRIAIEPLQQTLEQSLLMEVRAGQGIKHNRLSDWCIRKNHQLPIPSYCISL